MGYHDVVSNMAETFLDLFSAQNPSAAGKGAVAHRSLDRDKRSRVCVPIHTHR